MNKVEIHASNVMNYYINSLKEFVNIDNEFDIVKDDNDIKCMSIKYLDDYVVAYKSFITLNSMINVTRNCVDSYLDLINSNMYSNIDDFRHIVFMYTHYNSLLYGLLSIKNSLNDDDLSYWFFNSETCFVSVDNVETIPTNDNVETIPTTENDDVETIPTTENDDVETIPTTENDDVETIPTLNNVEKIGGYI